MEDNSTMSYIFVLLMTIHIVVVLYGAVWVRFFLAYRQRNVRI
jgi:hypothetical protein